MISCKLCNTALDRSHLRKDGSLLCPVCGQVYWKAAVEKVLQADPGNGKRLAPARSHMAPARPAFGRV